MDEWRQEVKDLSPQNPASRSAVPGLIAIVNDPGVPWYTRRQMAITLGRLGKTAPEAVPVLIELLDDDPTDEHAPRIWAAKALSPFGPEARTATPRLVAILQDDKLPVAERQGALETLAQIGGAHPRAIPALVETLNIKPQDDTAQAKTDADTLRELAVESIASVGKDAGVAAPVLMRFLNDSREPMRRKTATALGRIGPVAQLAIPSLVESLAFDESPAVRDAAETALAEIGTPAIPALVHLLEDQEAELRRRAAGSLGQMKTGAKPAVPQLEKRLEDSDPLVRFSAARSVWQITGQAEKALPVFVETLKSSDRSLRMQAFRILTTELGPQAAPARPGLMALRKHPDPQVSPSRGEGLGTDCGMRACSLVPGVCQCQSTDEFARNCQESLSGATPLGRMGKISKEFLCRFHRRVLAGKPHSPNKEASP